MSRQNWSIGQTVKVGFLNNLVVIEKIPTPADWAPDAYVLLRRDNSTYYRFVPHKGISRCVSLADARVA